MDAREALPCDQSLKPAQEPIKGPVRRAHTRAVLGWYDRHRRVLPWRAMPGEPVDPYRVWLSEIMLQQTQVVTATPYFEDFLSRWPNVSALAAASMDEVLVAWQGLGYYARARNLVRCAQIVAKDHGGIFPNTIDGLLALPGIGAYTAAAVGAIAFGRVAVVVDGNVERVIARIFAVETLMPAAKPEIRDRAAELSPAQTRSRPGDYAQAMMDLGATVCTPKAPRCDVCPLAFECRAHEIGAPEIYPLRIKKAKTPVRYGAAWMVVAEDGALWLQKRPEKGLLGAMMEVPSTDWQTGKPDNGIGHYPHVGVNDWVHGGKPVVHVFTHFRLELTVFVAKIPATNTGHLKKTFGETGRWVPQAKLVDQALPTVMKKVIAAGLKGLLD
ncbi:MAG: A/G-specific adenine glycosylase [Rhodospirillales bacterium]|nr:A/G-specific adenine glycosylase [Rhodospirillales bacterium]